MPRVHEGTRLRSPAFGTGPRRNAMLFPFSSPVMLIRTRTPASADAFESFAEEIRALTKEAML